jgi:hypothetical protein
MIFALQINLSNGRCLSRVVRGYEANGDALTLREANGQVDSRAFDNRADTLESREDLAKILATLDGTLDPIDVFSQSPTRRLQRGLPSRGALG